MNTITSIAKKTFTSHLNSETSFGSTSLGTHESTMELFAYADGSYGIEWDIDALDTTEHIGIWVEAGTKIMEDYDGVFGLPQQAIELLEENGFNCDYAK